MEEVKNMRIRIHLALPVMLIALLFPSLILASHPVHELKATPFSVKGNDYYILENQVLAVIINNRTGMIYGFETIDKQEKLIDGIDIDAVDAGRIQIRMMDGGQTNYAANPYALKIFLNYNGTVDGNATTERGYHVPLLENNSLELAYDSFGSYNAGGAPLAFATRIRYILHPLDLEIRVNHRLTEGMKMNESIAWLYYFHSEDNYSVFHRFDDLVISNDGTADLFFAEKYSDSHIFSQRLEKNPKIIVNNEILLPLKILEDSRTRTYTMYGSYDLESPLYFHRVPNNFFFGLFPSTRFRGTRFPVNHSFNYSFFITRVSYENYSMIFLLDNYLKNILGFNDITKEELDDREICFDRYRTQMLTYDPVSRDSNEWDIITNKYKRAPRIQDAFPNRLMMLALFVVCLFISIYVVGCVDENE